MSQQDSGVRRLVDREITILVALIAVTIAVFFATRRFAAANELMRRQDAEAWHAIGDDALRRGDLDAAVRAFRRATAKNPDDVSFRRALATALMTMHEDDEALRLLIDLHEQQGDDAETDLQLARLEARRGDRTAAGRYYQTAIVALWPAAQRAARQRALTEFITFLLARGERDRALSELLVLETALNDDAPSQVSAGGMLLAAGDARRALVHFERARQLAPADAGALAGAADAAFELGDYAQARRYLNRLSADTDRTRELRTLTRLVLDGDPLAPRLSLVERRRRLADALSYTVRRLDDCQTRAAALRADAGVDLGPALTETRALDASMRSRRGVRTSDDIESAFDAVYRGARDVNRACGAPEPRDRALLLIGRRHGLETQ